MKQTSYKRRALLFLLAASIFASCMTGCGNGNLQSFENAGSSSQSEASSSQAASSGQTEAPKLDKLVVAMASHPNVENFESNYLSKRLQEENGVKVEFQLLPADRNDAKTKFSLLVSSGSALPDVLNMNIGDLAAADYASKGVFVPLNDYYQDTEIAKNFLAIEKEDRDAILKALTLPDGNVYSLFNYGPSDWNSARYRMWINQNWLNTVQASAPSTTDELYDVLKAFSEKDPNGNGKKDEIGVVGSKDGWGQQPFPFLMSAFLNVDPSKNYLNVDENGQIYASYTKPEWKEGLTYMAKLCAEGLLSPLSFTQDYTQLSALINVSGGAAGMVSSGSTSTFDEETLKGMSLLAPLTGPEGVCSVSYVPALPNDFWYITKDCKNPAEAFEIGDYFLSFDTMKVSRYGEKDVDWTDDPAVCSQYEGVYEATQGVKPVLVALNNIWSKPQNKHWQGTNPAYLSAEKAMACNTLGKKSELLNVVNYTLLHYDLYMPHKPERIIPKLTYTAEENERIANSKTTIDSYAYDTAVAFITGNKPLSEWDSFLSELEKMGLTEYLKTAQTAYDRVYR